MALPKDLDIPYQINKYEGSPVWVEGDMVFDRSIRSILLTTPGERPYRPTFGSWLRNLVFANMSKASAMQAGAEARRALATWEKRIDVREVLFELRDTSILLSIFWQANGQKLDQTTYIEFPV